MNKTCEIDGAVYETRSELEEDSCKGCHAQYTRDCHKLDEQVGCLEQQVIWIKKEEPAVKATEVITFTEPQVNYLSEVFGIDATEEVLKVSDGFVKNSSKIWWKYNFGPEHVKASEHWDNIKDYPDAYSVKEPKYKVVYD
jgi:hypothetical protein